MSLFTLENFLDNLAISPRPKDLIPKELSETEIVKDLQAIAQLLPPTVAGQYLNYLKKFLLEVPKRKDESDGPNVKRITEAKKPIIDELSKSQEFIVHLHLLGQDQFPPVTYANMLFGHLIRLGKSEFNQRS